MRNAYLAMESISALIILILLYANIFEVEQHTKKRQIFIKLIILNLIVVASDAVTWLPIEWQNKPSVFFWLIAIAYIIPFFIQETFSTYVYEHISEKAQTNHIPFRIMTFYSIAAGISCLILCVNGKMFSIQDGIWSPESATLLYYCLYLLSLSYLVIIVLLNVKKLGVHDSIAALTFIFFPLISIIVSISSLGLNLAITFMGIDMLVIHILLQFDNENKLIHQSINDELTDLYNRRAYEDDLLHFPDVPPEPDFIYASIDINGLKQINDTLGHAAGDELICGTAYCLKKTFGNYGKIYRTGGDEFVSMFFTDDEHLHQLIEDLKNLSAEWKGENIDSLSVSVGYATKREFSTETVKEMAKIADNRMYKDKAQYYASKGIDRRGQNAAHKVLCSLYTKIIKINLTYDNFQIINMNDISSQLECTEKISTWLENFGKSGNVHPDDLENYLSKTNIDYMRRYFQEDKSSLTIFYRRKYDDVFKQTMMDIIPADDYSNENQSMFLYVKSIDL